MMFMRHISLCIILQLVHPENCADLKNVEFAGSIINKRCQNLSFLYRFFFFLFHSKCSSQKKKKAPLDRVDRKVKKNIYIFFRVGPKNRVGRDMGNRQSTRRARRLIFTVNKDVAYSMACSNSVF